MPVANTSEICRISSVSSYVTTLALFFLFALLALLPVLSYAHAFPDHSIPKVGETLATPPAGAYIWFDGELEPAFCRIMVQDTNGKTVDQGNGRVNPVNSSLLEVGLLPLPSGTYRVKWIIVSKDGHRISGDYTFAIK